MAQDKSLSDLRLGLRIIGSECSMPCPVAFGLEVSVWCIVRAFSLSCI